MSVEPVALEPRIEQEELWHFLGYPPHHTPPRRIAALAEETLREARALVVARGAFVELGVDRSGEVGLEPIDAQALVVGLVTAGAVLEQRVRALLDDGQTTRALLLDAAGSAAVEEAADLLGACIVGGQAERSAALSCRLSPGYGRWSLGAQPALFALLPHDALGVRLLPTMLMSPRKSISFAMWLGARGPIGIGASGCSRCDLRHCRYRRERPARPEP